jgi:hypothetical protein
MKKINVKEGLEKEKERKSCVNCLHCKQSKFSTPINNLAFCKKKKERKDKGIEYWETKKTCYLFDDMGCEDTWAYK